ncbi:hypothetical protein TNCV_840891 [Trichonephila clavipes]|nr:hypothetical protein TNCV_840891 [Trichonephila clavipes]
MNSSPLTYSELHSTYINNKQANVPSVHHWYEAKRPVWWFSFPSMQQARTNYSNSFPEWPPPNFDFKGWKKKLFQLVLGVLPARHLQHTFLTAWGFQNKIFMKTL